MQSRWVLAAIFSLAAAIRLTYIATLSGHASFFAEADTDVYWALGWKHLRDTLLNNDGQVCPLHPMLSRGMPRAASAMRHAPQRFAAGPRSPAPAAHDSPGARCSYPFRPESPRASWRRAPQRWWSTAPRCSQTRWRCSSSTAAFLATALFLQRPALAMAAGAGLLAGLALAARPSVALLLPAMAAMMAFRTFRTDLRRGVVCAALFCATAVLPIAPTLIRNYVHFDRVALTSQSGDHLAFWIAPMLRQRADGTPYEATVKKMADAFDDTVRQAPDVYANPFDRSALKARARRAPSFRRSRHSLLSKPGWKAPPSTCLPPPSSATRVCGRWKNRASLRRPARPWLNGRCAISAPPRPPSPG